MNRSAALIGASVVETAQTELSTDTFLQLREILINWKQMPMEFKLFEYVCYLLGPIYDARLPAKGLCGPHRQSNLYQQ